MNNVTCPQCRRPMVYEWHGRDNTGWCLICGYYEYYSSYIEFLSTMSEGDAGV